MESVSSNDDMSIDTSLESPPKNYSGNTMESIIQTDSKLTQSDSLEISISQTPISNTSMNSIENEATIGSDDTPEWSYDVEIARKKHRPNKLHETEEWDISSINSGEYSMDLQSSEKQDCDTNKLEDISSDLLRNIKEDGINKSVYSSVYGDFVNDCSLIEESEPCVVESSLGKQPFLGFTTGNNKRIEINEKDIQKSRELLGIDASQGMGNIRMDGNTLDISQESMEISNSVPSEDNEIPDIESFTDLSCRGTEIKTPVNTHLTDIHLVNTHTENIKEEYNPFKHKIGHPSTAVSFKTYLQQFKFSNIFEYLLFKYACLHLQHKQESLSVENINKEIKRRNTAEYSVLRRIFEGNEISTIHCVLKVLERRNSVNSKPEWLVFDGFYEAKLLVDPEIEKDIEENKIKGCFNIQLSGMRIVSDIQDFQKFTLKVDYNCLFVTTRSVGFQKEKGVIKPFSDIKYSGLISGLEFKVLKIISRKVTLKCGDFKQTFSDELDTTEKMKLREKFVKTIEKYQRTEEIQMIPFANLLIEDTEKTTAVLTWFHCPDLSKGRKVRMVNVKVGRLIGLSFVTCFLTEADLVG